MNLKNRTVETIFTIIISIILITVGIYYINTMMFIYPILFIILGARNGKNYALFGLAISALSIGLIMDILSGIFIFIAFAPFTMIILFLLEKKRNAFTILASSALTFLISILLILSIMNSFTGMNIISGVEESLSHILDYQMELLKSAELSNYEVLKIKDFLESAYDYILLIMPSIIMIFSTVVAYINYFLSTIALKKLDYGEIFIPKFSGFRLPNNIILGTIIMFLGAFIFRKLGLLYHQAIFVNLTVIISALFFTQGLSVLDYLLVKKGVMIFLRILIIAVLVVALPLGWIMPLIGVLDSIFDFRKFRKST